MYDTNGDYQQEPQLINGSAFDSKTGAWSTVGTEMDSSEVNATITYSGTFSSIGIVAPSGYTNPSASYRVDGGSWLTAPGDNGVRLGNRAAHTIDIRVDGGTLKIDKFVAI